MNAYEHALSTLVLEATHQAIGFRIIRSRERIEPCQEKNQRDHDSEVNQAIVGLFRVQVARFEAAKAQQYATCQRATRCGREDEMPDHGPDSTRRQNLRQGLNEDGDEQEA